MSARKRVEQVANGWLMKFVAAAIMGYCAITAQQIASDLSEGVKQIADLKARVGNLEALSQKLDERFDTWFSNWRNRIPERIEQP